MAVSPRWFERHTGYQPADRARRRAFVMVTTLFFFWAFVHNINGTLIPHLRKALLLTDTQSALIDVAIYLAYFLAALPAGMVIARRGYRFTIIAGLSLFALGAVLFVPAALSRTYGVFLLALFVFGFGAAFLETVANPYISGLGDREHSTSRLNFAQSFNGVGAVLTPLIGSGLILSGVTYSDAQLAAFTPLTPPHGAGHHQARGTGAPEGLLAYAPARGTASLGLVAPDGQLALRAIAEWGTGWAVTPLRRTARNQPAVLLYAPESGSWQTRQLPSLPLASVSGGPEQVAEAPMASGTWPAHLAMHAADLTGDGADEVIAYGASSGTALIASLTSVDHGTAGASGSSSPTSSASSSLTSSWTTGWTLAVGDVDGDGRDDVLLLEPQSGLTLTAVTRDAGIFEFTSSGRHPDAHVVGSVR